MKLFVLKSTSPDGGISMKNIILGTYEVHGEICDGFANNAYYSDVWYISVLYDGVDIYTEDEYGDTDVIGTADTTEQAKMFVKEYFAFPWYRKIS